MVRHRNFNSVYKNEISKERARELLSLNKDQIIFLHIGNIRLYKAIDMHIDNFKQLKNNENIKLFIDGKSINREIENVFLYGSQENSELLKLRFNQKI